MQQRDLLKEQIEQLGKVLAKLLANFLDLKEEIPIHTAMEISQRQFKEQLDFDFELVSNLSHQELKTYLETRNLKSNHIETLSEYYLSIGESLLEIDQERAEYVFLFLIRLLDASEEISQSVSFTQITTRSRVEKLIGS